jgi:hypothetical protein
MTCICHNNIGKVETGIVSIDHFPIILGIGREAKDAESDEE